MTRTDLRDMLELFGQEQACYTALLNLSRKQKGIIATGDVDDLLTVLAQKQQILQRVADVEESLRPYKGQWRKLRERLDANDRQILDDALSTVEELLGELIALEKESEALLQSSRDAVHHELQQTVRGESVNRAYGSAGATHDARFLDVRSE